MKLKDLLTDDHPLDARYTQQTISGLCLDSRQIKPGDVFIALSGSQHDGRDYIRQAIDKGAVAVFCNQVVSLPPEIPLVLIPELHRKLPEFASTLYSKAMDLKVIGVTGTSGKTSICHLLAHVFEYLSVPCAYVGTLGMRFQGRDYATGLTTPDLLTNFRSLDTFAQQGARYVAMEASSHALEQGRMTGLPVETAVFTNLSHEHLDYHGNLQAYAAAKKQLFQMPLLRHGIFCANSPYTNILQKDLDSKIEKIFYGIDCPAADVVAEDLQCSVDATCAQVRTPWGNGQLSLNLTGHFHMENALAVISALCLQGMKLKEVLLALERVTSIPGRMESLGKVGRAQVFIDYAHKPDALEHALLALKRLKTQGHIWCVFGCGGDRDIAKRALMGKIAEQYADRIIITNDNPRSEDPEQIAEYIQSGISNLDKVQLCLDRADAIKTAMLAAGPEDFILIAGKGHESTQILGAQIIEFSDKAVVEKILQGEAIYAMG